MNCQAAEKALERARSALSTEPLGTIGPFGGSSVGVAGFYMFGDLEPDFVLTRPRSLHIQTHP